MSRLRAFLVIACLQAALGGVAAREWGPLTVTKVDDATLRLEGRVGPGDADRVLPALSGRETRLLLSVVGGEAVDAIRIGRALRPKALEMVVDGLCASACAQFILPAGRSVTVTENSLVLFHHYLSALVDLGRRTGLPPSQAQVEAARLEAEWMRDLGIHPDIAGRAQLELDTRCVAVAAKNGLPSLHYFPVYAGWVPRREYLRKVGISIGGFWPTSVAEIAAVMESRLPPDKRFSIKLSMYPDPIPADVTEHALDAIKPCP